MNHQEVAELIHPYLDNELDAANARGVEEHLRDCEECRAVELRIRALQKSLTDTAPAFAAPARLRKSVRKALRHAEKEAGENAASWFGLASFSLATALLLVSFLLFQNSRVGGNTIVEDVISDHVRSLLATHLVDVPSSDQHTVKPWFNGKVDFAPEVRDFSAQGFPLVGGRLDYLHGKTVAALVYRRNQHPINVLIAPAPGEVDLSPTALTRRGYNVIRWRKQQMEFWAVSDLNANELRQLADYFLTER
ncbi:MAG: anti-sigma factor family protein [Chthoniobacterales bacterium]